jgi:hypothetical protein
MNEHLFAELEALRSRGRSDDSATRLKRLLEEEGFTTPSRFADLLLELVESDRRTGSTPEPIGSVDASAIDQRRNPGLKVVHRPPRGPFYWRGRPMEPRDIERFNGVALHFAIVGDGAVTRLIACESYREVMHLLQRDEKLGLIRGEVTHQLQAQLSAAGALVPADGTVGSTGISVQFEPGKPSEPPDAPGQSGGYVTCPAPPPRPTGEAQFFQHAHFDTDGHWFWLGPGWQIPRLTDWKLSHSIFASSESWNDHISSIKTGDGLLVAFEAIDFVGSSLTLRGSIPTLKGAGSHPMCGPTLYYVMTPPRQEVRDLGILGWNDRISSLQHYPNV